MLFKFMKSFFLSATTNKDEDDIDNERLQDPLQCTADDILNFEDCINFDLDSD